MPKRRRRKKQSDKLVYRSPYRRKAAREKVFFIALIFFAIILAVCVFFIIRLSNQSGTPERTSSETESTTAFESESETVSETKTEETTKETSSEETTTQDEEALRSKVLEGYNNPGVVYEVNNYVNIRSNPSVESPSIGKAFKYSVVEVVDESDLEWYQVEVDGKTGYIKKDYVAIGQEASRLAEDHARLQIEVTADVLNVRERPSTGSDVLTTISVKDRYDIIEKKKNWTKIHIMDGLEGYVKNEFVTEHYFAPDVFVYADENLSEQRRDIINMAFEYYGGEYVWGGTQLGVGVDCSGFTMRIYKMFGVELQRNSYYQAEQGKEISPEEMKPGDLIFYHGYHGGVQTQGVGHVAIYIGNGKIIHAASETKGICLNEWNYVPYLAIRNVIGD